MSEQRANIEITASSSRLAAGLRAASSRFNGWAGGIRAGAKKIGGGAAGSFVGNVGAGLAGRGIDFIADQGRAVMDFENQLTRLQINAGKSSAEMDTFRQKARNLSKEVGLNANDILAGTVSYVDLTGDVDGAGAAMEGFARIAQASGSSVSDIATATAALKQSFNIKPEQVEAVFSGMIMQGKAGAVTLKDFAGELSSLAPKWAKFADSKSAGGIAQFGAAFQVARQGFGSASEAATGMEALMGGITMHAKDLRKFGKIEVFNKNKDGSKTLKSFEEIISSIEKSKLVKDPELMGKALGGRKEATDTLNVLLRARQNLTATGNEYTDLVAKGKDAGAVQRDLATYLDSSSGKMATSWEGLRNSIAEALTPERIEGFANAMKDVASHAAELAEGLGKIFGFIGSLNSLGKSVRGFFSGNENGNPFGSNPLEAGKDANTASGAGDWIQLGPNKWAKKGSAEYKAAQDAAKQRIASRGGYNKSVSDIMGGEVNERTTPESIRRAAMASFQENIGSRTAGNRYLANVYGTGEEVGAAKDKVAREELQKAGSELAKGLLEAARNIGVTLKIGDNTVAKANVKATDPRRKL
jgi:TP901 family phage tail tape measure protein